MEKSRRRFLKVAGITALGVGVKPTWDVLASDSSHDAPPQPKIKKGDTAVFKGFVLPKLKRKTRFNQKKKLPKCLE